ncbi:MAG TPA: outer membrane lipoprotein-sorting protein [Proteobacteria bacterium]|nr:outer membrane lipoprotein-sorting protein [Pseudomonadota bacterium]
MKRTMAFALCVAMVLGLSGVAWTLTGNEILAKVDEIMNAPKDRVMVSETILIDKNGNQKKRLSKIWQKGDKKRLIKFLEPPSERGVGFLAIKDEQGNETMHLYMPAFKKVRRIASHIKHGSFMGTDFSYDDTATMRLCDDYNAELVREEDKYYVLKLVPKPEAEKEYSYVMFWVTKDNFLTDKGEFYDKNGKLLKVQTNTGWKKYGNYWQPAEMKMHNVQDNHTTIMKTKEVKFDLGLGDDLFTIRNLKRPPK